MRTRGRASAWPRADGSGGWFEEASDKDEHRSLHDRFGLTSLGTAWLVGAVATSLVLILTTATHVLFDPGGILGEILFKLDLRFENNPAATWSGMLLALAGVHAFDGYARERLRRPATARGWALIALVLLALSADEISSLHERAVWLGVGSWWPKLPPALVLGGMLGCALILLWREQANGRTVVQLVLGFVVLASAALHEFVEHRFELTSAGARAVRAVLEEGSELCGMLILLQVAMRNTAGLAAQRTTGDAAFEAVRELRLLLAASALVLAPFLAYATSLLPDYLHRGRPADWVAAIVFFAAALAACRAYFASGQDVGWHRWLFSGLCMLAVLVVIDSDPERVIALGPLVVNLRLFLVAILGLLAWSIWPVASRRFYAIGGVALGVLAGASLLPPGPFAVYLLSQLVALTVYLVCTATNERAGGAARSG